MSTMSNTLGYLGGSKHLADGFYNQILKTEEPVRVVSEFQNCWGPSEKKTDIVVFKKMRLEYKCGFSCRCV